MHADRRPSPELRRSSGRAGQMPVLRSIRARFADEQPLAGVKVGACLHVTAETANLVLALREGGADVALCAANPYTAQADVAAALGENVHVGDYAKSLAAVAAWGPDLVLDDGAELIAATHASAARRDGGDAQSASSTSARSTSAARCSPSTRRRPSAR